jgi:hypothetical protein
MKKELMTSMTTVAWLERLQITTVTVKFYVSGSFSYKIHMLKYS